MKVDTLKPLGSRVIVKPVDEDTTMTGGIIIPTTTNERLKEGKVVSVGPGKWSSERGSYDPMNVKVGDRIMYGKYAAIDLSTGGDELVMVS